jgi:hypothetical protein
MRWRETAEWIVLFAVAWAFLSWQAGSSSALRPTLLAAVAVWAAFKTFYYFAENLRHLQDATNTDLAYHKFVVLLAYNMAQITISYAIDFYCLVRIDPESLNGVDPELTGFELMFECFYFSVLNFSFFGYGDITPAHVPGKVVMLLEVVTAFSTVIFLLSDFVSMKESMRRKQPASMRPAGGPAKGRR